MSVRSFRYSFCSSFGLACLLLASASAAQDSNVYSRADWLTKAELRSCLLLDNERVSYEPVVENLRRQQQAAAAQYMVAYDSQDNEEEALARFQRADAAYGEAQARADAMEGEFAATCADRPYSRLHFNELRSELGFGWSSPQ